MSQIFHPSMNAIAKASIAGVVLAVTALSCIAMGVTRSPYLTGERMVRDQPVPFSHEHHVNGLGIDCRYCHTSVEKSSFAGIPPTKTCMTCHSQIWTNAAILQPVRTSWATNKPIEWTRVNNLPDYVYFNHSIHIAKGIGCNTCHGQVNQMPLMFQAASLRMEWCLGCHREPELYIRPKDQVFNMNYQPPSDQLTLGKSLVAKYKVRKDQMTNCSICHR